MTVVEPYAAKAPDQAPLAVQALACELDQVSVALWPGVTAAGFSERVAVALGGGVLPMVVCGMVRLHPERTKARRRKRRQDNGILYGVGKCISPRFLELVESSSWI